MDPILAFFSTLILVTAGILVALFWIVIFVVIGIEVYDLVTGYNRKHPEDDEEEF